MPRIEYTLSFDNYLEMTSGRREKRDLRIAAIAAVSGFFCIAAGSIFLEIHVEAFLPGELLLATGLLLTCCAAILGFLAKPKSLRPDTKVLRREYDLFNADQYRIRRARMAVVLVRGGGCQALVLP